MGQTDEEVASPNIGIKFAAGPGTRGGWQPANCCNEQWEQRLLALRVRMMNGVRSAQRFVSFFNFSILICCLAGFIFLIQESASSGVAGFRPEALAVFLFPGIIPAVVSFYCVKSLLRLPRIFPRAYIQSSEELSHGWTSRLYVDEELHRLLQLRLDQATVLNHGAIRKTRSFEQQLEFCACHLGSLKRLAADPEAKLPRSEVQTAQTAMRMHSVYSTSASATILIGCIAVYLLSFFALIIAAWISSAAPAYLNSRGAIVALIDFILERPDSSLWGAHKLRINQ